MDWKNVLLTIWHASLVLGAAYAASHNQWGWAVAALTSMAGMSQAPSWTSGKAALPPPLKPPPGAAPED